MHQETAPAQVQNLSVLVELGEVNVCSSSLENASIELCRWKGQTGCSDT